MNLHVEDPERVKRLLSGQDWLEVGIRASVDVEVGLTWMRELLRSLGGFVEASGWVGTTWDAEKVAGNMENGIVVAFVFARAKVFSYAVLSLRQSGITSFWDSNMGALAKLKSSKTFDMKTFSNLLLVLPDWKTTQSQKDVIDAVMSMAARCLVEGDTDAWKGILRMAQGIAKEIGGEELLASFSVGGVYGR